MTSFDGLEIFCGQINAAQATVYVRLPAEEIGQGVSLSGEIRGPHCRHSHTIVTKAKLIDQGPGSTLLAKAFLPDPCCWTAQLPFLYRVKLDLRRDGQVIDAIERDFGVRPLTTKGKSFFIEGRRWVLRGVHDDQPSIDALDQWRSHGAALVVAHPDEALCRAASEEGVMIVARLTPGQALLDELKRLAAWPAVAMGILEVSPDDSDLRGAALGMLLVQSGYEDHFAWADAATLSAGEASKEIASHHDRPLIAVRRLANAMTISESRRQCDHLQRDMVPFGDFAGYLV